MVTAVWQMSETERSRPDVILDVDRGRMTAAAAGLRGGFALVGPTHSHLVALAN